MTQKHSTHLSKKSITSVQFERIAERIRDTGQTDYITLQGIQDAGSPLRYCSLRTAALQGRLKTFWLDSKKLTVTKDSAIGLMRAYVRDPV